MAPPPYSVGTIVVQSLTGAGTLVLGAIVGLVVGGRVVARGQGFDALANGMAGALIAMPLGFGVGVWGAGAFRGHQGSFWATMGATILGTVLSVASLGLNVPFLLLLTLPATAVGTIWVYHLTDARARDHASVAPPVTRPEQLQRAQSSTLRGVSLLRMTF